MYRQFNLIEMIFYQKYRLKLQRRDFAATLAVQALPALHVGTLWQGAHENDIESNQKLVGSENDDSSVKINGKEKHMKKKSSIGMRKPSSPQSQVNHRNTSDEIDILSSDSDISMIRRCQRRMSQTITSFYLTVPNMNRRRSSIFLKVSKSNSI